MKKVLITKGHCFAKAVHSLAKLRSANSLSVGSSVSCPTAYANVYCSKWKDIVMHSLNVKQAVIYMQNHSHVTDSLKYEFWCRCQLKRWDMTMDPVLLALGVRVTVQWTHVPKHSAKIPTKMKAMLPMYRVITQGLCSWKCQTLRTVVEVI